MRILRRGISYFQETAASRQRERYWRSRLRFHRCVEQRRPHFPNQKDVNDLIRDLGLTKSNAELLISRLKQWNLLDESVQVTDQRKRHETFSNFFSRQDGLCFCNNVACLFEAIGITCNPMAPIHRQFIPEPQSRAASQRKQLPVSPYSGSLCASQGGLYQTECQDVAECLEVYIYMSTMNGSSETSKWCHSLWAFKAVSQNFLVSFASGTAVTLRRTWWPISPLGHQGGLSGATCSHCHQTEKGFLDCGSLCLE